MCGLLWVKNQDPTDIRSVNKKIIKQYVNQKRRGVEGFGLYDIENEKLVKETSERRIIKYIRKSTSGSRELMFHHRTPTSTPNVKSSAHPFSTKDFFEDKEYILIHNGHIDNALTLANLHADRKIKYESMLPNSNFNDSEALLWDIALTLHGEQEKPKAVGRVAFICYEKDKKDPTKSKLHYYRNPSANTPLFIFWGKKYAMLMSEPAKGQEAILIQADKLHTLVEETMQTYSKPFEVTQSYLTITETNRDHLKEADEFIRKQKAGTVYQPTKSQGSILPELQPTHSNPVLMKMHGYYSELEKNEDEELDQVDFESAQAVADMAEQDRQWELFSDTRQLETDYKNTVLEFLAYSSGFYQQAIEAMRERLIELSLAPYDIDIWYQMRILEGGIAILIADPFWNKNDAKAVQPDFVEKPKDKAQPALALSYNAVDEVSPIVRAVEESYKEKLNKDAMDKAVDTAHTDAPGPVHIGEVLDSRGLKKFKEMKEALFPSKKVIIQDSPGLITTIPREAPQGMNPGV